MKSSLVAFVLLSSLFPNVLAHYRFYKLIVNGTTTGEYQYVRSNTNTNSPVTDISSTDLRCNVGGLASGATTSTATVVAGSTVGFALDIGIIHPGVVNAYISKAPSTAASYDGSGKWTKIYQVSAVTNGGTSITWPANDQTQFTFKIPASTPSGEYLLRIEHIALHSASATGGAQFYISCANIKVVNGGSGNPSPSISLPGGYSASDPGLLINIYWPIPPSYTQPGPAVWSG